MSLLNIGKLFKAKTTPEARTGQSINYQKQLTRNIISKLNDLGFEGLLCGGAPRDWHLGRIVQDLDIYVSLQKSSTMPAAGFDKTFNMLKKEFKDIGMVSRFTPSLSYDVLSVEVDKFYGIKQYIFPFITEEGQRVQLMVGLEKFDIKTRIIPLFSCSICEYYWDSENNKIFTSELNLKQLERQTVLVDLSTKNSEHVSKMKVKFDSLKFHAFPYHIPDRVINFKEVPVGAYNGRF